MIVHLHTFPSETDFLFGDLEDDHAHYLVQADKTGFKRFPKVLKVIGENFEPLMCYAKSPRASFADTRVFARRAYPQSIYLPDSFAFWPDIEDRLEPARLGVYAELLGIEDYKSSMLRCPLTSFVVPFCRSNMVTHMRTSPDMQAPGMVDDLDMQWDLIPTPIFTRVAAEVTRNALIRAWTRYRHAQLPPRACFWLERFKMSHETFRQFLKHTTLEGGTTPETASSIFLRVNLPHDFYL